MITAKVILEAISTLDSVSYTMVMENVNVDIFKFSTVHSSNITLIFISSYVKFI